MAQPPTNATYTFGNIQLLSKAYSILKKANLMPDIDIARRKRHELYHAALEINTNLRKKMRMKKG
jgi:hypothetical protein